MAYQIKIISDGTHAQKCRTPAAVLKDLNLKAGDVVLINNKYVCRVFLLPLTDPEKFILVEDSVQLLSLEPYLNSTNNVSAVHDFKQLKISSIDKLFVDVILDVNALASKLKSNFSLLISKILQMYIVGSSTFLNCRHLRLAKMFGILSIKVCDNYPKSNCWGRISRTATVEIRSIISEEHYNLSKMLQNSFIGGFDCEKEILTQMLDKKSNRILITGPSGCGKTFFVQKFCCNINCRLVIIDGRKQTTLMLEKLNSIFNQFSQNLSIHSKNVVFIDHIEEIVPAEANQCSLNILSIITNLCKKVEEFDGFVIATAVQKKLIHPAINTLFDEEIFLGMPSLDQQQDILKASLRNHPSHLVDMEKIGKRMPGFFARDIVFLTREALKIRNKKNLMKKDMEIANEDSKQDNEVETVDFEDALQVVMPSLLKSSKWRMKVQPVQWKDIGGMEDVKKRLQMCIEKPLLNPEIFQKVDLHCPKGVLLFGPPGCCKTTLAKGLATECNANFFAANPSQIYSPYVGESEKNISQLFYEARLSAPSIIFLDELDSLVGDRSSGNRQQQGVSEKVLSTFLTEMDGIGVKTDIGNGLSSTSAYEKNKENKEKLNRRRLRDEVIVVGATNRPDCIDRALLRPGRFDMILYIAPPNKEERISILEALTKNTPLYEVNLEKIAAKTNCFTGADLKNLCNTAAINAFQQDINAEHILEEHFTEAFKSVQPSVTLSQIQMYEQLAAKYGPSHFRL